MNFVAPVTTGSKRFPGVILSYKERNGCVEGPPVRSSLSGNTCSQRVRGEAIFL